MITFDIFYLGANSLGGGALNNLQSLTFPDRWQSSIVPAPTEKLWAKFIFILSVCLDAISIAGDSTTPISPRNFALENQCQKLSFLLSIHTWLRFFALGVFDRILFPIRLFFYLIEFHPECLSGLIRCYTHTCVSDGKQHYFFFVCYDSRFLGETIICCKTSIIGRGGMGY